MIVTTCGTNRIEIIYDSYIENSIKESERAHRLEVQPIDVIDLNLDSIMPVEMKSFWASPSNKHQLQIFFFFENSLLRKLYNVVNTYF